MRPCLFRSLENTPLHCPKVGTLTFVVELDSVGLLTSTTYIMDLTTYRKFKNLVTSAPRTQTTWSELGGLHVFYFDLNHVVTAKLKLILLRSKLVLR